MKIHEMSALELREALRRKRLSSVEIVEALIARRRAIDGKINAFVCDLSESALREARRADAERMEAMERGELDGLPVLHGLPITIKDNIDLQGTPSTLGLASRRNALASKDAVTVSLAKKAGAIVIGKTNVPQTLLAMETTNHLFGTTSNPWALDRAPGGSSGGEAAAIASGASVLGLGTDIGGSLRIPAAMTGIATLKPTLHRWSNRGVVGLLAGQEIVRAQIGPMARSAEEVSFFFCALDGALHAQLDPESPPLPIPDPRKLDIRGLRIGVYEDDGFITPSAPCKRAVWLAARYLEEGGASVVPYVPPFAEEHFYLFVSAITADGLLAIERGLGREPPIAPIALNRRLNHFPRWARVVFAEVLEIFGEKRIARLFQSIGKRNVDAYWELARRRLEMQRAELDAWNALSLDALICPATVTPAPPHGSTSDFGPAAVYTARYNLLNFPAGVIGITRVLPHETERPERKDRIDRRAQAIQQGSAGLPVGVQVVARPFREEVVLAIMMHIEKEAKLRGEAPPLPVDP
ncbi:MAG: amidase family protein [Sandaracinaceae bacterium]|nr:amidase family protein [Sandaracinaceae bacterium]